MLVAPDQSSGSAAKAGSTVQAPTVISTAWREDRIAGRPRPVCDRPSPTSVVTSELAANTTQSLLAWLRSTSAGIIIATPSVASNAPMIRKIGPGLNMKAGRT